MSYFCQFCDKEIPVEAYIVYANDYITCGEEKCTAKAKDVAKELRAEAEDALKETEVIIFSTKDPDLVDSWKLVSKEDHPKFLSNENIMGEMLTGHMYVDSPKTLKELYYCAIDAKDVMYVGEDACIPKNDNA